MRARIAAVGAAALVAAGSLGLGSATAQSGSDVAPMGQEVSFKNVGTSECLVGQDTGGLASLPCNGLPAHYWDVNEVGPSLFTLTSMQSGLCLDDSAAGLRQAPCNGSDFQKFEMTTFANGDSKLRNVATGGCVEDARRGNDGIRAFPCNTSPHQNWVWM
ncbi:RICIN domain-containing protein [Streptomyces sp. NPDC054796]